MDRINSTNPASYPINKAISAYAKSPQVNRPGGAPYSTQATGVRRPAPATAVTLTPGVSPTQPNQPTRPTETVGRIAPSPMTQRAGAIAQLVGAKVAPIDLSSDVDQIAQANTQASPQANTGAIQGPKPTVTSAGTYTMYPQPADRVQAATSYAANTGRSLDIRG